MQSLVVEGDDARIGSSSSNSAPVPKPSDAASIEMHTLVVESDGARIGSSGNSTAAGLTVDQVMPCVVVDGKPSESDAAKTETRFEVVASPQAKEGQSMLDKIQDALPLEKIVMVIVIIGIIFFASFQINECIIAHENPSTQSKPQNVPRNYSALMLCPFSVDLSQGDGICPRWSSPTLFLNFMA